MRMQPVRPSRQPPPLSLRMVIAAVFAATNLPLQNHYRSCDICHFNHVLFREKT